MHLRSDHAVRDLPILHTFIQKHPLGVLTTSLPSENHPTLQCSHIPWVLDSQVSDLPIANEADAQPQSLGILRGHIARQNPQGKAIVEASESTKTSSIPGAFPTDETPPSTPETIGHTLPEEVLIVFTSPVDHYITPNFYTESKPATGRVAPTWNYAAVQVYGRATIYHDIKVPETETFLRQQLGDLAKLGEEGIMGFQKDSGSGSGSQTGSMDSGDGVNQGDGASSSGTASPTPWKIADAPREYIAALLKNIVGMRIEITRIEGRFKVSQEKGVGDRGGVVKGLEGMGLTTARGMAEFVRRGRVLP